MFYNSNIKGLLLGQHFCGRVFSDPNDDFEDNNIIPSTSNLVWWGHPEPAVNTYYYGKVYQFVN